MVIIVAVFIVLISCDMIKFIREKESTRVFAIYSFIMGASLLISLLLVAQKRPDSPAQWIEWILQMIGVTK